jgi:hypothetical protein
MVVGGEVLDLCEIQNFSQGFVTGSRSFVVSKQDETVKQ